MYSAVLKAVKPDGDDTVEPVPQTCYGCKWRVDGLVCEAFPKGIPLPILFGVFDHHYHYEDSTSDDNGVVFSPLTFDDVLNML